MRAAHAAFLTWSRSVATTTGSGALSNEKRKTLSATIRGESCSLPCAQQHLRPCSLHDLLLFLHTKTFVTWLQKRCDVHSKLPSHQPSHVLKFVCPFQRTGSQRLTRQSCHSPPMTSSGSLQSTLVMTALPSSANSCSLPKASPISAPSSSCCAPPGNVNPRRMLQQVNPLLCAAMARRAAVEHRDRSLPRLTAHTALEACTADGVQTVVRSCF